jgi:hypothetical protein
MDRSRRALGAMMMGVALCAAPWTGHAQGNAPREVVRGTVASIDGPRLDVRTEDGKSVTMQMSDATRVASVSKASLDSIAPGSFVGTAAAPDSHGELVAQEVHIFPESMRGTGEGQRPYARHPNSTMTNATVAAVSPAAGRSGKPSPMTNATVSAAAPAGASRRLTLTYKDAGKADQKVTVLVPPDVPVVALQPGERSLVVPGAHVVAFATRQSDGALATSSVNVGKDGVVPPM